MNKEDISDYFFACPQCGKVRNEKTVYKVIRRKSPLCFDCSKHKPINKGKH